MADLFLSYKREDQKAASRLVQALRAEGVEVWWDRDIPAGAPWEATIEAALAQARVVLVCWSPASVASENVRSEARWARGQGRLIQVFVEPCEPPLFFGERQAIDLADWSGSASDPAFTDLLAAIHSRLGEPRADAPSRPPSATRLPFRLPATVVWIVAALSLVVLAAGGWFAASRMWSTPPSERIAILPFAAVGGGDEVKAFASGVTDELASALSGNGRPIVTGVEAQGLTGPGAAERIRKLGVRLLFSGSVAQQADHLNVRVQLDDPQHAVTLWTAALDGPVAQSGRLQAQIGARIIAVLNCTSRALRPKGGLSDPDAMTLLLKACDIFEDKVGAADDPQQIYALLDTTRQLTQKAPGFAAGHSLLAKFDAYYRYYLPASNDQLVKEAKTESAEALRLDPSDIDSHVAQYLLLPRWDFLGRDHAIMNVPFDPSWTYGELFRADLLTDVGRENEALAADQRAVAANPLSADQSLVMPLLLAGQPAAAEKEYARVSQLWSPASLWVERVSLQEATGDWAGLQAFLDDPSQQPRTMTAADLNLMKLVFEAARTRTPAAIARARAVLMNVPPGQPIPLGERVMHLAWLGLVDDAFALTSRMSRQDLSLNNPAGVLFYPQSRALRQDPRFMALTARFGLVDYWTTTGVWPDFCSQPGLPYDCKAEAAKQKH